MRIIIKTKNLESSEVLNKFIEKKFSGLEKFIDASAEVSIEVEKETKHHKKGEIFMVKAMVSMLGRSLMAQAKSDDLFKAVVIAKDELKMEIEKYKFKKIDKDRREQMKKEKNI
jgi:ribosomal subunit interface protein